MRRIRRHLTFANVTSLLALFLVLTGGTAVALSGSDTVFTDDIANDTVPASGGNPAGGLTPQDLRPNSVTHSEIRSGEVASIDVSDHSLATEDFGTIPAARAKKTFDQTVVNDTYTPLNFNTENFDTAALRNAGNNSRLTAPISGVYQVSAGVDWAVSATGFRELGLAVNAGTCCFARSVIDPVTQSGGGTHQTVSDLLKLSAGDYVEARVKQTSGGPLAARALVPGGTFLAMHWVGSG